MTALNPALTPFLEEIRATARPSVVFNLSTEPCAISNSKVGGMPYWPEEMAYPSNPEGQPLCLLAQINFTEMPALPDFPSSGILQFFIDGYDGEMGVSYDNLCDQSRFRVVYHREIRRDRLRSQWDGFNPPPDDGLPFPFGSEYRMRFLPAADHYLTRSDYRLNAQLPNLSRFLDGAKWQFTENYEQYNREESHRVGGYPFFTQDDPRCYPEDERMPQNYELLFQLASYWGENEEIELMWGDAGVGNFFIHPEDLRRRDFSRVAYTMDCC